MVGDKVAETHFQLPRFSENPAHPVGVRRSVIMQNL